MGVITGNTFDGLRRYVAVRLQQGVPLVDADWNAMEDTRRYELRAYLKWFVGDGVPEGNDGFRIVGNGAANDVQISKGYSGAADALRSVGRVIVDGLDVMIVDDVGFRGQPLHTSQGAAADALAAKLGVPKITEMPSLDGTVAIYLDVWERIVTAAEDPALVLPGLGIESCARLKREWVVRARAGTAAPTPATPAEYINGHSYYLLATVAKRTASPNVRADDVTDRRELRLMTPPSYLVSDVLGTPPADYRRGTGRPVIPLRDAINALLRGELPSSPDTGLLPAAGTDAHRRGFFFDGRGGLVATWQSDRAGGANQVLAARLALSDFGAGFPSPPIQVTSGATPVIEPHAAPLPGGDVLLVYTKGAGPNADVFLRRGPLAGLPAAAEQVVAQTAAQQEDTPFVVVSGNLAVVIWHNATTSLWMYRRYRHTDNTFIDPAPGLQLSSTPAPQRDFHAAVDPSGKVWSAFRAGDVIQAQSFDPLTAAVANPATLDAFGTVSTDQEPFVLCRANGEVRVFWSSVAPPSLVLATASFTGSWTAAANLVVTGAQPSAVELPDGRVWVFFALRTGTVRDVYASEFKSGGLLASFRITSDQADDFAPFVAADPATGALYALWTSDRSGNFDLFYKRIVTSV